MVLNLSLETLDCSFAGDNLSCHTPGPRHHTQVTSGSGQTTRGTISFKPSAKKGLFWSIIKQKLTLMFEVFTHVNNSRGRSVCRCVHV